MARRRRLLFLPRGARVLDTSWQLAVQEPNRWESRGHSEAPIGRRMLKWAKHLKHAKGPAYDSDSSSAQRAFCRLVALPLCLVSLLQERRPSERKQLPGTSGEPRERLNRALQYQILHENILDGLRPHLSPSSSTMSTITRTLRNLWRVGLRDYGHQMQYIVNGLTQIYKREDF